MKKFKDSLAKQSADEDKFKTYSEERKSRGKRRHSNSNVRKESTKWFDKMN